MDGTLNTLLNNYYIITCICINIIMFKTNTNAASLWFHIWYIYVTCLIHCSGGAWCMVAVLFRHLKMQISLHTTYTACLLFLLWKFMGRSVQISSRKFERRGWLGGAKVLCILHHRGVQLILAYIWVRPAILVVGKGRGGMFLFLLFLHFHSCSSFFPVPLFHLLYSLFYLSSPVLWETTQNDPQGLTCR